MKRTPAIVAGGLVLLCLAFAVGRITGSYHPESKSAGHRVLYYVDPMHPAYRSDKPGIAPDCGMALEPVYEGDTEVYPQATLQPGGVALTAERQQLIGIRVAVAAKGTGLRSIRTTGRVVPEDGRLYRIQAGFEGWVDSLSDTPPGTLVKRDQVLATLYGPEVRSAELNYIGYMSGIERLRQGMAPNETKSLDDSKRVNEEQLRLLGMGEEEITQIGNSHRASTSLNLVSPGNGIVLSRSVSPRQRFEKGTELYRIADLSKVWVVADVHGNDGEFKPGMHVKVNVPELAKTVDATVSSTIPLFDETSRTLKMRLEADNPGMLLRPDMFVDVEFETRVPAGLSIPADAVIDSGLRKIVYVETSDGVFEPRPVDISGIFADQAMVADGISEGDRVVVSGNFLLDSESRMRASENAAPEAHPEMTASMRPVADSVVNSKRHGAAVQADTRDPVCGMTLKASEIAFQENYKGKTFSFCSDTCRKKFLADPAKYVAEKATVAAIAEGQAARQHD
jgi:membrane fusion protein, copper/silver efflux system